MTSTPTNGALEARSALVHVHTLTGRNREARNEIKAMYRVAEALPDADAPAGPWQRAVSFNNFVEARFGTRRQADRAWDLADRHLRETRVWHVDARVYHARALVQHGDIGDGVAEALAAVRSLPAPVHTIGVAVADLLRVVPDGHRSDDLDELATHATGPGPWVTLG